MAEIEQECSLRVFRGAAGGRRRGGEVIHRCLCNWGLNLVFTARGLSDARILKPGESMQGSRDGEEGVLGLQGCDV